MINFKVVPDDGDTYEVAVTSRDVYLWEKTNKDKRMGQLAQEGGQSMVDSYALAYLAAKRTGQFSGTLDEFSKTVDLSFAAELDEEPDPTQPVP